jgi:hypothetical protein
MRGQTTFRSVTARKLAMVIAPGWIIRSLRRVRLMTF